MRKFLSHLMIIILVATSVINPGLSDYSLRIDAQSSGVKKLVIDPGHGGSDSGANHIVMEKKVVLKISLLLEEYLKSNYQVDILMTRNSDVRLSLADRTRMANAWGADYFFSVHANAFNGEGLASGYEDFIHNGNVCSETVRIRDEIHPYIAKVWTDAGRSNRGKKVANFHVLRETDMPAMLVELGFVDNAEDAALLKDKAFIEKLVREMGEGIASALRLLPLQGMEGPVITTGGNWTGAKEVPVTINSGNGAGVDLIEYRLLGATDVEWRKYTGEFHVKDEGITFVHARNVYTSLGIVSDTTTAIVRIDRTGPDKPTVYLSEENWTAEDVTFSLKNGVDYGKEVDFSWDDVSPNNFSDGVMDNISLSDSGGLKLERWEETFEAGNSLALGDMPAERKKDSAFTGVYGLKATPKDTDDEVDKGKHSQLVFHEQLSRGDDFYYSGWVRTDSGYIGGTGLTGLSFGVPWDVGLKGYQAVIDVRNGSDDTAAFQLRNNYWTRLDFDDSISVKKDTWYKIEILWDKQGKITARLYNRNGSLLSELSAVDNTYNTGLYGVAAYSNSSFDDLEAGRYRNSSSNVVIGHTSEYVEGNFHHILFRAKENFSGDLRLLSFNSNGFKNNGKVEFASVDGANGGSYKVINEVAFTAGQKEVTLKNIKLEQGRYYVLGHTNGYYRYPTKSRPSGRFMEILKGGHIRSEIGTDKYERTYGFAEYIFIEDKVRGMRVSPPVDLSFLGIVGSSTITWDALLPQGSRVTVETSLDGKNWQNAVNGGSISGIKQGDNMGGRKLYMRQILESNYDYIGPHLRELQVNLAGNPGGSGAAKSQYRIGSEGAWVDYNGSVKVNMEGETAVFARTIDRVGNVGSETISTVKIDRTPPVIDLEMKKTDGSIYKAGNLSSMNVIVTAKFSDKQSGVKEDTALYSVDKGISWVKYTGPFVVEGEGVYEVIVRVADKVGNAGEVQTSIKIGEPGLGDVNGDGSISVTDAIILLRYIVGMTDLDETALSRARVNGTDAPPSVTDAIAILRYVVGLITEFPTA